MYLYQRGKGAHNRVMHVAAYDRVGNILGALCGTDKIDLNTSINVPLARPVCKRCKKELQKHD